MGNEHNPFKTTQVKTEPSTVKIDRADHTVWMGSCFVENMAHYLRQFGYNALVNPLGVVFNPVVLSKLIQTKDEDLAKASFEKGGVWMNLWLGAPFYQPTKQLLDKQVEEAKMLLQEELRNARWLVITWGTAFWYEHNQMGMVGKCHKLPASQFIKKSSSVEGIANEYVRLIQFLRHINPDLYILFTVSPVRHSRDGLEANAVSKAKLRLAVHELQQQVENVFYFPAYELVLDELRDYRFFEDDLVHPNRQAVQYIWDRFSNQFFSDQDIQINDLIRQVEIQKAHRPMAPFGEEFEKWQNKLKEKEGQLHTMWGLKK